MKIAFDRLVGGTGVYTAAEPCNLWPLIRAVACENGCFFEIEMPSPRSNLLGAAVHGMYCLFERINPKIIRVLGCAAPSTVFVDVVDRRWPHIYFVPRGHFVDYEAFSKLGQNHACQGSAPSVEFGQRFSDVGLPSGSQGDALVVAMLQSDATGLDQDSRLTRGVSRLLSSPWVAGGSN